VVSGQDFRVTTATAAVHITVEVERVYGPANWALKNGDAVINSAGVREHRATLTVAQRGI
jgi:hypothetical protein